MKWEEEAKKMLYNVVDNYYNLLSEKQKRAIYDAILELCK